MLKVYIENKEKVSKNGIAKALANLDKLDIHERIKSNFFKEKARLLEFIEKEVKGEHAVFAIAYESGTDYISKGWYKLEPGEKQLILTTSNNQFWITTIPDADAYEGRDGGWKLMPILYIRNNSDDKREILRYKGEREFFIEQRDQNFEYTGNHEYTDGFFRRLAGGIFLGEHYPSTEIFKKIEFGYSSIDASIIIEIQWNIERMGIGETDDPFYEHEKATVHYLSKQRN